jgi:alkyl sulfatase BDS1-like metallo-beta-lactamase superfamily hydrolase
LSRRRNIVAFIESQRDTYKYIHDRALRFANKGYTPLEAAEIIELPSELGRKWYNRGYHGTVHHDVRAVFTKELGMWDGDPVSLHPHPPVESAKRFVDLIGADKILAEGQRAFDAADYRWAAEILHKLVFACSTPASVRHRTRSSPSAARRPRWSASSCNPPPPKSSPQQGGSSSTAINPC